MFLPEPGPALAFPAACTAVPYIVSLFISKKKNISLERKVAKSCLEFPNILYLGPLGFRFTVSAFLISLLSPTVVS